MLKRIRQLHISLAAKCQLLFGAAVVLIIAAALFVPWQRMEQLTEQLNERSARTLIEFAIKSHVADPRAAKMSVPSATRPTTSAASTSSTMVPSATGSLLRSDSDSQSPAPSLARVNADALGAPA